MENFGSNEELPLNAETLIDSHISPTKRPGKLFETEKLPHKIIRVEQASGLLLKHDNVFQLSELVHEAEKLYRELEEKYGISVPFDKYEIGKNTNGEDVVFCVADKIVGVPLEEADPTDEFVKKVEFLYTSVAKYFLDKSREGGMYLWDINGQSQYIYGKKFGENDDKIHLIDTDIWVSRSRVGMYLVVEWLTRHMRGVEMHVNKKFEIARDYVRQFIDRPLPDEMSEANINQVNQNLDCINKFLNDEKVGGSSESAIPPFE